MSHWVCGTDVHLDVCVSKCDNIRPPCSELCRLRTDACAEKLKHFTSQCWCILCGVESSQRDILALGKPQNTTAWHAKWHDRILLKHPEKPNNYGVATPTSCVYNTWAVAEDSGLIKTCSKIRENSAKDKLKLENLMEN